MTVTAQVPSYIQIPGNGTGTVFAFPFKCFAATDILVGFVVGGAYAAQTTGFAVGNIDVNGGGTVTFTTPPPNGTLVDIRSVTPLIQPSEFANLGAFLPEVHTDTFDRVVRELQDVFRRTYTFGIHGPDTEAIPWPALPSAAARANMGLVFDGNGLPGPGVLPTSPVTRSVIGALLYPQLVGEVGVVNTAYPYYNVIRYGADPTGASSSLAAFNAAYNSAMAAAPHGAIYIPAGTYLIDSPGLTFTNQNDIRITGDGPRQSLLIGGITGSYTPLSITADIGQGTTGNNVNLSNFGIQNNGAAAGTNGLLVADYLGCTLVNMVVQASGNAIVMKGVANVTAINVNSLTWESNSAGNTSLALGNDTFGIGCGPCTFISCEFNGQGNVTSGAAVSTANCLNTIFNACQFIGVGPALQSVAEFSNGDDITVINPYTESSCNTTNNTASLFVLGRIVAPINFTLICGRMFSGNGTFNLANAILGLSIENLTVIGGRFANFAAAAISYNLSAGSQVFTANNKSQGGAALVFPIGSSAPIGSSVPFYMYPFQSQGWGTPQSPAVVANINPSTITLPQLASAVGQLILDAQARGQAGK